jgi:hypothetical protein
VTFVSTFAMCKHCSIDIEFLVGVRSLYADTYQTSDARTTLGNYQFPGIRRNTREWQTKFQTDLITSPSQRPSSNAGSG